VTADFSSTAFYANQAALSGPLDFDGSFGPYLECGEKSCKVLGPLRNQATTSFDLAAKSPFPSSSLRKLEK
jgi:hypothetical protein